MSSTNGQTFRRRSFSQTGFLAALCGGFLLFASVKFSYFFREMSSGGRLLFNAASGLLVLWGLSQIVLSWYWPAGRGRTGTEGGRVRISWLGLFLILIGLVSFDYAGTELPEGLSSISLYALGAVLVAWGLREILAKLVPTIGQRRFRQRQMLTQPGVVYLAVTTVMLLGSLLGRSNMLMLMFSLMIGAFVLNGWVTYSMLKRIRVVRRMPPRAMAGETVSVEIVLENRKRLLSAWLMIASDRVTGQGQRVDPEVVLARVPPRKKMAGSYQLRLMQRGRYEFGPMDVSTRFPLALVERGITGPLHDEILIYPRLGRLLPAWRRELEKAAELVHRQEPRRGTFDDDFHSLREYRWGDNPRAIHWRTSARHNELMVCEYHESRDRCLLVLLDLWLPPRPRDHDLDRVELAVSFCATLCAEQMRRARDADLFVGVAGEQLSVWRGQPAPSAMESLLDELAVVQGAQAPSIEPMYDSALKHRTPGGQMVLVTTRSRAGGGLAEWERVWSSRPAAERGDIKLVEAEPVELGRYYMLEF